MVASIPDLNHMLFPGGGGLDLNGAKIGREPNTIELDFQGTPAILCPKRLLFESFDFADEWNYFWLEAAEMEPILGVASVHRNRELLLEIAPTQYISSEHWYEDQFEGCPLPTTARLIERYVSGAFVIFHKRSTYNLDPATYDGRHNYATADVFRQYINRQAERLDGSLGIRS
jgi:hypothetical protein